jgi:glyoxylase-like metal-dependent hydrolase (beta-lactamase superfamily II)
MEVRQVSDISPNLKLIDPQPPIPGYWRFIGTYVIFGEQIALVDPGPAAAIPNLLSALSEIGVRPEEVAYVVLTHIHMDHAGGIGHLMKGLPNAKVLAHSRATPHLINPRNLWEASRKTLGPLADLYGPIEAVPEHIVISAADGMVLDLGSNVNWEIQFTPGHAVHHMSLFDRAQGILIAGEAGGTCLDGSLRPTTAPPFKLDITIASVDRLIALNPDRLCYGHFGCYTDGVNRLKLYKSKLLTWYALVNSEVAKGNSPESVLSSLRSIDHDLDYLSRLDKDEYHREFTLLINSIYGLAGLAR